MEEDMAKTLETFTIVPAVDPRSRFGTLTLGYDRVEILRAEHAQLRDLAALICDVPTDKLTLHHVETMVRELKSRVDQQDAETPERLYQLLKDSSEAHLRSDRYYAARRVMASVLAYVHAEKPEPAESNS